MSVGYLNKDSAMVVISKMTCNTWNKKAVSAKDRFYAASTNHMDKKI